jgi:hypothetical protein
MASEKFQFMVEFAMPEVLSERFTNLIPDQRAVVNQYFSDGKLLSYAVSLENSKIWAVFLGESHIEVEKIVKKLPLTRYMKFEVSILTFFNLAMSGVPSFSVN